MEVSTEITYSKSSTKNCQTKILNPTKLPFKKKDEINQINKFERIRCLTRNTKGSPSS